MVKALNRRMWDWTVMLLTACMIPLLLLETRDTSESMRLALRTMNWIVWLAFCADVVGRWAGRIRRREHEFPLWVDLWIVVLSPPIGVPDSWQWLRLARLVRVLRAVAVMGIGFRFGRRALQHRQFHYVALSAAAIVVLGALSIFVVEGGEARSIASPGDALWWAVVTATTVGYGDLSPETLEGRLTAVVLMITGIGVIGVFTATIASFFVETASAPSTVESQLADVQRKLDQVLERLAAVERERRADVPASLQSPTDLTFTEGTSVSGRECAKEACS